MQSAVNKGGGLCKDWFGRGESETSLNLGPVIQLNWAQ